MKKVLVSINQRIAINPQTTFGGLVKVCEDSDAEVEYIGSIGNNYDFDGGRIRTSRFVEGAFVDGGFSSPNADLWIFYADGYQNDTAAMGFSRPLDYHERMMSFLETQVSSGNVGEVINSPETERRTLKSYFARLNPAEFGIIPTYLLAGVEELREALREKGKLGDDVLPFWVVFQGDITRDPKRVREITCWYDGNDAHFFFWRDIKNKRPLIEHFTNNLSPLLSRK